MINVRRFVVECCDSCEDKKVAYCICISITVAQQTNKQTNRNDRHIEIQKDIPEHKEREIIKGEETYSSNSN
jgi:hypothetical protein